jgi:hypothetical protein
LFYPSASIDLALHGPSCVTASTRNRSLTDIGLAGPDKGAGGRYLIVYPLSAADAPPKMHRVDAAGVAMNALPPNDQSYFDMLASVLDEKPADREDFTTPEAKMRLAEGIQQSACLEACGDRLRP